MDKETDRWVIQVSYKLGPHMINVRADSMEEILPRLQFISDNAPEIEGHVKIFDQKPPEASGQPIVQPALAPAPAPDRPSPTNVVEKPKGTEVGPVVILKVEQSEGVSEKTGRPWTRYVVAVPSLKASTFDTLLAASAKNLLGKQAYLVVTKGNFGYELEGIRAA